MGINEIRKHACTSIFSILDVSFWNTVKVTRRSFIYLIFLRASAAIAEPVIYPTVSASNLNGFSNYTYNLVQPSNSLGPGATPDRYEYAFYEPGGTSSPTVATNGSGAEGLGGFGGVTVFFSKQTNPLINFFGFSFTMGTSTYIAGDSLTPNRVTVYLEDYQHLDSTNYCIANGATVSDSNTWRISNLGLTSIVCSLPILEAIVETGSIYTHPTPEEYDYTGFYVLTSFSALVDTSSGGVVTTPTPTPTPVPEQDPKDLTPPSQVAKKAVDKPQCAAGSIIHVDNLSVGESVPLVGAPFSLYYFSDRVVGRADTNMIHIPLTGSNITGIKQVDLKVEYAGRVSAQSFQPTLNLSTNFRFDGLNSLGNLVEGSIPAKVTVTYENLSGKNLSASNIVSVGGFQAKALGLGGWTASNNHFYDTNSHQLYLGDGNTKSVAAKSYNGGLLVTSDDGSEAYLFSLSGQHLETRDTLTNALKMKFSYDSNGRLIAETDAFGNQTRISYNGNNPIAITSPYGQVTHLAVDSNGYLASVKDPANGTFSFTSLSNGLLQTFTKPNGHFSQMTYDSSGRLVKDAANSGSSSTFTESVLSGTTTIQKMSAMNRKTLYTSIDGKGGLDRTVTDPSGAQNSSVTSTYLNSSMSANNLVSQSNLADDPRFGAMSPVESSAKLTIGNTSYSLSSKSTTSASVLGSDILNLNSLVQSKVLNDDPRQTYQSSFDGKSRTISTISPEGMTTKLVYNSNGQLSVSQLGQLTQETFSYDQKGRLSQAAQGSRQTLIGYNALGQVSFIRDALGLMTSYKYDAAGRVVQQVRPDGKPINYAYDFSGNLISLTPASGALHQFSVNLNDDPASYQPPLINKVNTGATLYSYNLDKQLTRITKADGSVINYNYGASTGILDSVVGAQSSLSYSYEINTKQISSVRTGEGLTTSYTYVGPLKTSESTAGAGISQALHLAYANDMKLEAVSLGGSTGLGRAIDILYDRDQRPIKIGDESLVLDPQSGLLKSDQLYSVKESLNYNSFGEMTTESVVAGKTALFSEVFTRNANGQITEKVESTGRSKRKYSYLYDSLSRLVEVKIDNRLILKYSYDANGNRTKISGPFGLMKMAEQYDEQDRLVRFGSATYSYDKMGNRIKKSFPSGHNRFSDTLYAYDSFGHLKSVTLPDGKKIEYVIDGLGRRVGKKVNGKLVQTFIYQSQYQIAAEADGNGKILKRFIYVTKSNTPDYMITASGTYRLISDQVGSIRMIIDTASNKVVDESIYSPFGEIELDCSNKYLTPFGFAGGLHDRDTGLTHFGAREYDGEVGRWISKDPIGFAGGDTNLYSYVLQDPVNLFDNSGNIAIEIGGSVLVQLGLVGAGYAKNVFAFAINPLTGAWQVGMTKQAQLDPGTGAFAGGGVQATLTPLANSICDLEGFSGGIGGAASIGLTGYAAQLNIGSSGPALTVGSKLSGGAGVALYVALAYSKGDVTAQGNIWKSLLSLLAIK